VVVMVGHHTKVVAIFQRRKRMFLLVELYYASGNHHSLEASYIINSQSFWNGSKTMGPHFSYTAQPCRTLLVTAIISCIYKKFLT